VDVLIIMSREDVNQVPVIDAGEFAGIITRSDLLR
jgi:CBS domain-containing protein